MDDPVTIELVLDNCCTNHVCYLLSLFSEMREAPINNGILGIGGIRTPEGIGTITFQITDSTGKTQQIDLKNVLYIPDAPKNLISISQWSEERQDNCVIFSRGRYFIFTWKKDKCQNLVPHLVNYRIPMMQVNKYTEEIFEKFTN